MEGLLVILITIAGAFAVRTIFNIIDNVKQIKEQNKVEKIEPCKLHNWYQVVDQDDQDLGLFCMHCKKTPKQLQMEYLMEMGNDE